MTWLFEGFIFFSNIFFCTAIGGVGLYLIAFFLLLINKCATGKINIDSKIAYNVFIAILLLALIVFLDFVFHVGDVLSNFKQFIIRVVYLINLFLLYDFYKLISRLKRAKLFIVITIWLLVICAVYELLVIFLGLPSILFLVNNPQFATKGKEIIGNAESLFRLTLLWSEPALSACVIGLFITILITYKNIFPRYKLYISLMIIVMIWTFSRSLIIPMFVIAIFLLYLKIKKIRFLDNYVLLIVILSLFLLHLLLVNFPSSGTLDLSYVSRFNSIIIGYKIFSEHWLLGTGFNSYLNYSNNFSSDKLFNYNDASTSLSILSSYLQQMGVFGFLYLLVMILLVDKCLNEHFEARVSFMIFILAYGLMSAEIFYFPVLYLFLAIAGNFSIYRSELVDKNNC